MRYHKNDKVRMVAASVLSYRLSQDKKKLDLDITLARNQFEIFDHTK